MVSGGRLKASVNAVLILSTMVALVASLLPVTSSAAATSATLSQCTNGAVGPPLVLEQCAGASGGGSVSIPNRQANAAGYPDWVSGNSNRSKSHSRQGHFIPH